MKSEDFFGKRFGEKQRLIASPPFACGLGVLMDIFLRLDINFTLQRTDYWRFDDVRKAWHLNEKGKSHFAHHVSITQEQDYFPFSDGLSFISEHRFDLLFCGGTSDKAILFVRDPVDSIYSWHRRHAFGEMGMNFQDYLNSIIYLNWHIPYRFMHAPPLMIFALYCSWWISAFGENLVVIRFEDLKRDGFGEIKRVLGKLNIARDDSAIEKAVEGSSFEKIQARKPNSSFAAVNRKSQPFEWQKHMSAAEHARLLDFEPMKTVMSALGYPGFGEGTDRVRSSSPVKKEFLERVKARTIPQFADKMDYWLQQLAKEPFTSAGILESMGFAINPADFRSMLIVNQVVSLICDVLAPLKRKKLSNSHLLLPLIEGLFDTFAAIQLADLPRENTTRITLENKHQESWLGGFLERNFPESKERLLNLGRKASKLFPGTWEKFRRHEQKKKS